jgi:galactokinase
MDQTIALFAELGKLKLIEFNPRVKVTDIAFPEGLCLVISNSLTPSPKLKT